jgi:hypothetical protein
LAGICRKRKRHPCCLLGVFASLPLADLNVIILRACNRRLNKCNASCAARKSIGGCAAAPPTRAHKIFIGPLRPPDKAHQPCDLHTCAAFLPAPE